MSATSAGIARSPYLLTVRPRACRCVLPAHELGVFRDWERATQRADGYWALYVGFYGDYELILWFEIVDRRTGEVLWRNGKPTRRRSSDNQTEIPA